MKKLNNKKTKKTAVKATSIKKSKSLASGNLNPKAKLNLKSKKNVAVKTKVKAKGKGKANTKVNTNVKTKSNAKNNLLVNTKTKSKTKSRSNIKSNTITVSKITKITKPVKKEKKQVMTDSKNTNQLKLGTQVSKFSLPMTGGKSFDLSDFQGKKVVLYFYPKDATPGCTQEGHDFSKLKTEFEKYNTVVFGVSRDSISSHEKFKTKQSYTVDLISDEASEVCNAFDVIKDKNMYGKKVRGIERSTFVIDEKGNLIGEWRKVKVEGHAQEVLEFVKK